ncbi:hypothetical protein [Paenisporosarcina quisquiliarum]
MPKPSMWIFFKMPLIPALISLAIPYYDQKYLFITVFVYFGYVLMVTMGK